jgi:type VI secretion system protein ImpE
MLYLEAIHAEQTRQEVVEQAPFDGGADRDAPVRGTLDGRSFESLQDADARIGPRLEVIAGGDYLWLPFRHVASIEMSAPRRLRDLLWARAAVRTGPGFGSRELGEVLLPAICVSSWRHDDEAVRLGRVTVWEEDEAGDEVPYGQKMLMVDDELIPLLEVRRLEIQQPEGTPC